jgi:hypothetical protein
MKIILLLSLLTLAFGIDTVRTLITRRVNDKECVDVIVNKINGGKGNPLLTGAISIMQNVFRDMATSSSGEVRNKLRKDISRIFQKISKSIDIDTLLIDAIKKLEKTSISIEDAAKLVNGLNFDKEITSKDKDICSAVRGAIDDVLTGMELNTLKDELVTKVIDFSLKLVKAGLGVASDTASDTGIGVAASVGIKALQAALDLIDSSWFSSQLNKIMRISRASLWKSIAAVVEPQKFQISVGGKVLTDCNQGAAIKIINYLKWTFRSLTNINDRIAIRNACRYGGDKDVKTFRVSTGQTVWKTAIDAFESKVVSSDWGKAMQKDVGSLTDAVKGIITTNKDNKVADNDEPEKK